MESVLITGCSSGIGKATALDLARAGHNVYASMRDPGSAPDLKEVARKEQLRLEVLALDVDSDQSVKNAIDTIRQRRDTVHVLINNAGAVHRGVVEELDLSEFRAVMETNYFGPLRCIKAVYPDMRARQSGTIINVTSTLARAAFSPLDGYSASKAALDTLSEVFAQEAKLFGVRVHIVEPPAVDTRMMRNVESLSDESDYPFLRRHSGFVAGAIKNPIPPHTIAKEMRELVEGQSWQLRHGLAGAQAYIDHRTAMTDEEWREYWGTADDEAWYANLERDFGMNARID
jgi:NAD(P)-dependent dehydrogenase (short-subunit alcohol dehydrogenase family)